MRRRHTDTDYMRLFVNWGILITLGLFWYAVYKAFEPILS